MRLLIATVHRRIAGGAERYLQTIIPPLVARGHDLSLLHDDDVEASEPIVDSPGVPLTSWSVDRLGMSGAVAAVHAWSPEVVFSCGLLSPALEDALIGRYPTAMLANNYHGTCATGTKCHGFPEPRPCSRTLGPACLLLHYPRRCGGLNPVQMWSSYRLQSRRHALLPRYDAVIVPSRHMRDEFLRHGVAAERLHLIPVAPPDAARGGAPRAQPFSNRVLFAGRLTNLKGPDYLLRALPIASRTLGRNLTLGILGSGPMRGDLEQLAARQGTPVDFLGWIDREQATSMMRDADLLVVPSVWPEPLGLVGIEAGQVGLPSVAFAVGGITDWLTPGISGELAPGDPPTVEGLADAMVRALRDHQHHADLRRGAWEMAERFTVDAHLAALEPLLSRVASTRAVL